MFMAKMHFYTTLPLFQDINFPISLLIEILYNLHMPFTKWGLHICFPRLFLTHLFVQQIMFFSKWVFTHLFCSTGGFTNLLFVFSSTSGLHICFSSQIKFSTNIFYSKWGSIYIFFSRWGSYICFIEIYTSFSSIEIYASFSAIEAYIFVFQQMKFLMKVSFSSTHFQISSWEDSW